MFISPKSKKYPFSVSSFSNSLFTIFFCLLLTALSCNPTNATEKLASERLVNGRNDERAPLLLREATDTDIESDIEQGRPRTKTGSELKKDILELKGFVSSLRDEIKAIFPRIKSLVENPISIAAPEYPDVQITDPQQAIDGMQTILNAFEYATEPDFREAIENDMRNARKPVSGVEENQLYLITEGLAAAQPDAPLTQIINELLGQARALQNQKITLVQYTQKTNAQRETQINLFKDTLSTLMRAEEMVKNAETILKQAEGRTAQNEHIANQLVQKRELYLTNLTTTLKRSLFISIPCALIAGGGAVYLFLHFYGR